MRTDYYYQEDAPAAFGEVCQEFTIVYYGGVSSYDVTLDGESSQFQWVSLDVIRRHHKNGRV